MTEAVRWLRHRILGVTGLTASMITRGKCWPYVSKRMVGKGARGTVASRPDREAVSIIGDWNVTHRSACRLIAELHPVLKASR